MRWMAGPPALDSSLIMGLELLVLHRLVEFTGDKFLNPRALGNTVQKRIIFLSLFIKGLKERFGSVGVCSDGGQPGHVNIAML